MSARVVYLVLEEGRYVARVFSNKDAALAFTQEHNWRCQDIRFTISKRTVETRAP